MKIQRSENKRTVYFFGSLPKDGEVAFGGGEVGNLRTIGMLRDLGFDVESIPRYKVRRVGKMKKLLVYPMQMIKDVLKLRKILKSGDKNGIVHVSGFYGPVVAFEWMIVRTAKKAGYKVIYEMRGGGADEYYNNGTFLYKLFFDGIIKTADCIFSQGKENYSLLHTIIPGKDIFYYPNSVNKDFLPESLPEKDTDRVNLLFFGRIEREKNVCMMVEILSTLIKRNVNASLTLIGNGRDDYIKEVKSFIKKKQLCDVCVLEPGCMHELLPSKLYNKHFYLFPTSQPHEGHSNALTEAMAYGLVPVASHQGFNSSVINIDKLIVFEYEASKYADVIMDVLEKGLYGDFSQYCYQRVLENFTYDSVKKNLGEKYDELFEKFSGNQNRWDIKPNQNGA